MDNEFLMYWKAGILDSWVLSLCCTGIMECWKFGMVGDELMLYWKNGIMEGWSID